MESRHLRIDEEEAPLELAALAQLWEAKRPGPGELPARSDFSPQELTRWMGHLAIYEVEPGDPFRLRTRLMGTQVVAADRAEHTDKFLDDYCPRSQYQRVFDGYREAWHKRKPAYRFRHESIDPSRECWAMKLVLPLARDSTAIDMFLVALYMGFPLLDEFDRTLLYV